MARPNLLSTDTTNFIDLIGNGRIYSVPAFQRDYSWSEEQWEDLWNDIIELSARPDDTHYMGALVINASNDRIYEIIDGQQRLATLGVIALAIISHLKLLVNNGVQPNENNARADALRARFIGDKDPASLVEASKLKLNETDNPFYQDYLVQLRTPLNPKSLRKSNRLLWDCFVYFSRKIATTPQLSHDGETAARLLSETIGRQLMFIRITVDDELNAYTVFETLNARGLELTATDLLKNYLFSLIHVQTDRDHLQRRWQALLGTIGAERFPELLRYHLLCELPQVRSPRLFKLMRERVKTAADVLVLIDILEKRAGVMAALQDPSSDYWSEIPEAKPYVRELKLFRVTQFTPIMFAADEKWERVEFARLIKLISVIAFRYIVIGDQNTNAIEPLSHQVARAILDETARRPRSAFEKLMSVYRSDESFQADFSTFEVGSGSQGKRLAKYVLARLENDAAGSAIDWETDPATIEHVLPENPAGAWEIAIPAKEWPISVDRIGNLTLLEKAINREVGSSSYDIKVVEYQKSRYQLTKSLTEDAPEEWTLPILEARQSKLARQAVRIWRSDFV